jgi:hypothetical protein
MIKAIKSVLPIWSSKDQIVIVGVAGRSKEGFYVEIPVQYTTWQNGLRTLNARAKAILNHFEYRGIISVDSFGSDKIPNRDGQYRYIFCEVEEVGQNAVRFAIDDDLHIGSFGPVRVEAIRWELIRRGRLGIDAIYAA